MDARRTAIVGYDGSSASRAALLWAVRETDPGVRVLAVCAVGHEPPPVPMAGLVAHRPGSASGVGDRALREWAGEDVAGTAELRLERGHPAEVLAHLATDTGAEVIVVGHRRGRRLAPARASVARDLLQHAPCPVVVVP